MGTTVMFCQKAAVSYPEGIMNFPEWLAPLCLVDIIILGHQFLPDERLREKKKELEKDLPAKLPQKEAVIEEPAK